MRRFVLLVADEAYFKQLEVVNNLDAMLVGVFFFTTLPSANTKSNATSTPFLKVERADDVLLVKAPRNDKAIS
jgi:hypothetical protein